MESEGSVCVQGVVSDVRFRDVSGCGGQGMIVWGMCELDEVECGTRVNGGDSDFFFFVVYNLRFLVYVLTLLSHSRCFSVGYQWSFLGEVCVCVCVLRKRMF